MDSRKHRFNYSGEFSLESGRSIDSFHLTYTTIGNISEEKDNVVWIFQAMTANSNPAEWWPGMVGEGKFFDPEKYFIICVNTPGSCYGSIGPLDVNPKTNKPYYRSFPFFTPLDMAKGYEILRKHLGIKEIFLGIGSSLGGQQLISWAAMDPELFKHIVPISTNAFQSPWGRAFNASQRMCIEADSTWYEDRPDGGMEGMKVARAVALLSYRSYDTYEKTQQDSKESIEHFKSESYQRYQGEKLSKRFNAYSYYMLSKSLDSHHLGRGLYEAEVLLQRIKSKCLVIGITSDLLFPVNEQQFLAAHVPGAKIEVIESIYGHDGFLLEDNTITTLLENFIEKK
jgi:homoserine O-acetyltransferase